MPSRWAGACGWPADTPGVISIARCRRGKVVGSASGQRRGTPRITPGISGATSITAPTARAGRTRKRTPKMRTPIPCESEHDFVLILDGISDLAPAMEDALYEAGCDDATISVRAGRVYLTFSRT